MPKHNTLATYVIEAIRNGFPWECPCGELHREKQYAENCRKCRTYLGRTGKARDMRKPE